MVKILENTYRLVNISLVNELALLCGKMDIDIWEVIDAAKTKPYGFQAFYPGPGIGGHCIPLDPFYLEYIAKNFNFDLTMINTAGHIDNLMPHRMIIKIIPPSTGTRSRSTDRKSSSWEWPTSRTSATTARARPSGSWTRWRRNRASSCTMTPTSRR